MVNSTIATGLYAPPNPRIGHMRMLTALSRLYRLDCLLMLDHFQNLYPSAVWDRDFSWLARQVPNPHALFDYQTLLGSLAPRAGRVRLGVGVTEAIRRHPARCRRR